MKIIFLIINEIGKQSEASNPRHLREPRRMQTSHSRIRKRSRNFRPMRRFQSRRDGKIIQDCRGAVRRFRLRHQQRRNIGRRQLGEGVARQFGEDANALKISALLCKFVYVNLNSRTEQFEALCWD